MHDDKQKRQENMVVLDGVKCRAYRMSFWERCSRLLRWNIFRMPSEVEQALWQVVDYLWQEELHRYSLASDEDKKQHVFCALNEVKAYLLLSPEIADMVSHKYKEGVKRILSRHDLATFQTIAKSSSSTSQESPGNKDSGA